MKSVRRLPGPYPTVAGAAAWPITYGLPTNRPELQPSTSLFREVRPVDGRETTRRLVFRDYFPNISKMAHADRVRDAPI